MMKRFKKSIECGCIIFAICCGIKDTEKGRMYLIGGHNHFKICNKCKQYEENNEDTLYDMWINDNITNDLKYADWEEVCNVNMCKKN